MIGARRAVIGKRSDAQVIRVGTQHLALRDGPAGEGAVRDLAEEVDAAIAGVNRREHPSPREFTLQGQVPLLHIRGRSLQLLVGDVLTPKGGRPATSPPGLKQDRRSL